MTEVTVYAAADLLLKHGVQLHVQLDEVRGVPELKVVLVKLLQEKLAQEAGHHSSQHHQKKQTMWFGDVLMLHNQLVGANSASSLTSSSLPYLFATSGMEITSKQHLLHGHVELVFTTSNFFIPRTVSRRTEPAARSTTYLPAEKQSEFDKIILAAKRERTAWVDPHLRSSVERARLLGTESETHALLRGLNDGQSATDNEASEVPNSKRERKVPLPSPFFNSPQTAKNENHQEQEGGHDVVKGSLNPQPSASVSARSSPQVGPLTALTEVPSSGTLPYCGDDANTPSFISSAQSNVKVQQEQQPLRSTAAAEAPRRKNHALVSPFMEDCDEPSGAGLPQKVDGRAGGGGATFVSTPASPLSFHQNPHNQLHYQHQQPMAFWQQRQGTSASNESSTAHHGNESWTMGTDSLITPPVSPSVPILRRDSMGFAASHSTAQDQRSQYHHHHHHHHHHHQRFVDAQHMRSPAEPIGPRGAQQEHHQNSVGVPSHTTSPQRLFQATEPTAMMGPAAPSPQASTVGPRTPQQRNEEQDAGAVEHCEQQQQHPPPQAPPSASRYVSPQRNEIADPDSHEKVPYDENIPQDVNDNKEVSPRQEPLQVVVREEESISALAATQNHFSPLLDEPKRLQQSQSLSTPPHGERQSTGLMLSGEKGEGSSSPHPTPPPGARPVAMSVTPVNSTLSNKIAKQRYGNSALKPPNFGSASPQQQTPQQTQGAPSSNSAASVHQQIIDSADLLKTPIVKDNDVAAVARNRQSMVLKDKTTYVAEAYKFDMDVLMTTRLEALANRTTNMPNDTSSSSVVIDDTSPDGGDGSFFGGHSPRQQRNKLYFTDRLVSEAIPEVDDLLRNPKTTLRLFVVGPPCGGKSMALSVVASQVLFPQIADMGRWEELLVVPIDWSVLLGTGTADLAVFYCKFVHHLLDCVLPHRPSLRAQIPAMIGFWKKCVTQRDAPMIPLGVGKLLDDGDALQWRNLASKLHSCYTKNGSATGSTAITSSVMASNDTMSDVGDGREENERHFMEAMFAMPGLLRDTFGFQNVLYLSDNLDSIPDSDALRDWRVGEESSSSMARRKSHSQQQQQQSQPQSGNDLKEGGGEPPLNLKRAILCHWRSQRVSFVSTLTATTPTTKATLPTTMDTEGSPSSPGAATSSPASATTSGAGGMSWNSPQSRHLIQTLAETSSPSLAGTPKGGPESAMPFKLLRPTHPLLDEFTDPKESVPCRRLDLYGLVRTQDILGIGLPRTIHCADSTASPRTVGHGSSTRRREYDTDNDNDKIATFHASIFGGVPGFLAKYAQLVGELRHSNILHMMMVDDVFASPYSKVRNSCDDVISIRDDGTVRSLLKRLGDALVGLH